MSLSFKEIVLLSAVGFTASLTASAQPLPGADAMCVQGQCASGNYCDFSALPNPICRAVPTATAPAPTPPPPLTTPPPPPASTTTTPTTTTAPTATTATPATTTTTTTPATPGAEEPLFRLGFGDDAKGEQRSVYRHIGIGYFGHRDVPIFTNDPANTDVTETGPAATTQVALITARWWAAETVGLDVGLGILLEATSREQSIGGDSTTVNVPEVGAFLLHVGVPWAVTQNDNVTMLLIPSVELGVTNRTTDNEADPDEPLQESGFLLAANLRAGAEVHLGFIGLPQIAVESTIGVGAAIELSAAAQGDGKSSQSRTRFVMPVAETPLDLLLSQIAVRYYF